MNALRGSRLLAIAALSVAPAVRPDAAAAQQWRTVSLARQAQGEEHLRVDVNFAGGRLTVGPASSGVLYQAELRYDERRFRPISRYRTPQSGHGRLEVGLEREGRRGDVDADERSPQYLELALTAGVPLTLDVETGMAYAELELGGLALEQTAIKTGASQTTVRFSAPNRIACRRFELAVGAAEVTVEGLGNARCARFDVAGGAGEVTLDFTGAWSGSEAYADIKLGFGQLTLRLPESLGVQVNLDRLLVGFDAPAFTRRGSRWVSDNYDGATSKLRINIDAAIGEIDVIWVK